MASFIRLIEQFAIVFYGACLVGIVWSIRSAWLAWRERINTLYALEREAYASRARRALLTGLGFFGLAVAIFFVAGFIAPMLPAEESVTPTPAVPLLTTTPINTAVPTPTLEPTGTLQPAVNPTVATIEPFATPSPQPTPALPPASCPDPRVRISAPGDGQIFSAPFQIYGTATIENFGFYKFVLNGPGTNFQDRTTSDVVKTPVADGFLSVFDPTLFLQSPGVYRLSLVVVDNLGNEAPHCTISLQFLPPTPAP